MNRIDQFRDQIKLKLQDNPILAWREELPSERVQQLRREHASKTRRRLWHTEIMVWFWLTAGLYRERSFNAVKSEIWAPLCVELPELAKAKVNSGRMAEGRARVPLELLRGIREELAGKGVQEGQGMGVWRGRRVLWLDGSTATMPDEKELHEYFGSSSNQYGPTPFPVVRIANLGVAATRIVIGSAYGPYRTSEKELSDKLLDKLQAGDVLTADRYFSRGVRRPPSAGRDDASAEILARVKSKEADAVMRKHSQLKLTRHQRRQIGEQDWIVELEIPPQARTAHPELPETIQVRVFHVVLGHGAQRQEVWIQTTLLDPKEYPKEELGKLYFTRWGAESSYAEVKVELHLDVLRSKTVHGVQREIEAHLAAYNYVRLQMLRAAKQAGVDPRELSFVHAVRTIVRFGQIVRDAPPERREEILKIMVEHIAVERIRPRSGRHEPRAVKRPPKPFPRLKESREEWRKRSGWAA